MYDSKFKPETPHLFIVKDEILTIKLLEERKKK